MYIGAMEEVISYMFAAKDCNVKTGNDKPPAMHKRKQDMVLSLNKLNQYSSDETPTPTKFLRNCEAIGLFKDLQNVNPFEETFRQATEAVKKGQSIKVSPIPYLGKSAGEDLHTPHIDLKDDLQASSVKFDKEEIDKVDQPISLTSYKSGSYSIPSEVSLTTENKIDSKSDSDDVRIYLRMSNGTLLQITSFTNNYEIPKSSVTSNGSTDVSTSGISTSDQLSQLHSHSLPDENSSIAVKKKLKEALMKAPKMKASSIPVPLPTQESKRNHGRVKEKQVLLIEDKEEDRKKRSLERNRIAAMKCREKRKKWVADLKDKYDKMCLTNQTLIREVAFLRKEVARLKGLLISSHHTDDLPPPSSTTINLVSPSSTPRKQSIRPDLESYASGPSRGLREGLRLDIEGATKATILDLDSPLIRRDEILSSVAPPTTPNEKLISFSVLDREAEISEERATTTVIQINPNALPKNSLVFS